MVISTSRPYFAPFPGFFSRIYHCDVFIILDNVQFPRGTTWITRNRFKNDQGILWMTVPVWKKGLGLQKINDVRICHEPYLQSKHLKSLTQAYGHAPYFSDHLPFLDYIFSANVERLLDLDMAILRHLMLYMGIETDVRLLSELNISAKGQMLLIEACKYFKASSYLAPGTAGSHLDPRLFEKAGVRLAFHRPRSCVYPQLWGRFIPDLSTFDLIFNCGPRSHDIMLAAVQRTEDRRQMTDG
jgi:hypothetical protein